MSAQHSSLGASTQSFALCGQVGKAAHVIWYQYVTFTLRFKPWPTNTETSPFWHGLGSWTRFGMFEHSGYCVQQQRGKSGRPLSFGRTLRGPSRLPLVLSMLERKSLSQTLSWQLPLQCCQGHVRLAGFCAMPDEKKRELRGELCFPAGEAVSGHGLLPGSLQLQAVLLLRKRRAVPKGMPVEHALQSSQETMRMAGDGWMY